MCPYQTVKERSVSRGEPYQNSDVWSEAEGGTESDSNTNREENVINETVDVDRMSWSRILNLTPSLRISKTLRRMR